MCILIRYTHKYKVTLHTRNKKKIPTIFIPRICVSNSFLKVFMCVWVHLYLVRGRWGRRRLTRALKIENSKWPIFPLHGIKTKSMPAVHYDMHRCTRSVICTVSLQNEMHTYTFPVCEDINGGDDNLAVTWENASFRTIQNNIKPWTLSLNQILYSQLLYILF